MKKNNLVEFPEEISILMYPSTNTWINYYKQYEHGGGGCYYQTDEDDYSITSSFVSLYPDGTLTTLWCGVEEPLDREWKPI